jgi:hypothetical protein
LLLIGSVISSIWEKREADFRKIDALLVQEVTQTASGGFNPLDEPTPESTSCHTRARPSDHDAFWEWVAQCDQEY